MRISTKKLLAFMIAVVMLVPIITAAMVVSAAGERSFTLNVGSDMEIIKQGTRFSGESERFGTDNYFTLYYADKTYVDENNKTFSDGKSFSKRINMQSAAKFEDGIIEGAIGFNTTGPATVKVWYVSGESDRFMAVYDKTGTAVARDDTVVEKNELYVATLELTQAGEYYLGSESGGNYIFCVEVEESDYNEAHYSSTPWDSITAPVVTSVADDENGSILVTVTGQVGLDGTARGADQLVLTVTGGNVSDTYIRRTSANSGTHTFAVPVNSTGDYQVTATLVREGEESKVSAPASTSFILPLVAPNIMSATSKGGGTIELEYTVAPEAEKYEIYFADGTLIGETTETTYIVSGLTIGDEHSFYVKSIRGQESEQSAASAKTLVTEKAQIAWGFTYYGPSTKAANDGFSGDLNRDGEVTIYSKNGSGKIQPKSADGIAFYYTKIPTSKNFTLRATITVDSWTYSNGQEGFGLLVTDRLGDHGDTSNIMNNQYMIGCTKMEYWYSIDDDGVESIYNSSVAGKKLSMRLGLGVITKRGYTPDNLETATQDELFFSSNTLETSASIEEAGNYNLVGNYTNADLGHPDVQKTQTQFVLEIQRWNSGYIFRYFDSEGNLIKQYKEYAPDALDQLDPDYVYAGFFAARNATVKVSDVSLTTINKEDDTFEEEIEITKVVPVLTITSASTCTSDKYKFEINANLKGTIEITDGLSGDVLATSDIDTKGRIHLEVDLETIGENYFYITYNPDDNQDLGEHMELAHNEDIVKDMTIIRNRGNYHRKNVYVSPDGDIYGNGSKDNPFDLATAVANAVPGQTIILMEGTYKFIEGFKIERGINGTEQDPIRLIADPEATSRPIIDFRRQGTGLVHGGDWWIFQGFDVTRSLNGQKGFQISGNHNTLIDIHAYDNGNTGIQISRYSGTDYTIADWPSYNLILNCDSYFNADSGYEDADGFAAKLTIGPGNVFDGCVAYRNADDGWDLYAKRETGPIGAVEIRNCIAYENGIRKNGGDGGNGNGFKMGGESITGQHILRNSIAFNNKAKGIDSNSCPDIRVYNCISFNNGSHNVALYTNDAKETDFIASGIVSFKIGGAAGFDTAENFKPKNQDQTKYMNVTNYYWLSGQCVNSEGTVINPEDIFVSFEYTGCTQNADKTLTFARNADGTLDLGDFLKIKDGSLPENVGTTGAKTASPEMVLVADIPHEYSDSWYNIDPNKHWQECECGDRINIGDHDCIWVVDLEPTETKEGKKHQECTVCGYKSPKLSIPATGSSTPTPPPVDDTPTEEPKDDTLSPGAVVAIVVAAVAVGGAGSFAVVWFVVKKKTFADLLAAVKKLTGAGKSAPEIQEASEAPETPEEAPEATDESDE